MTLDVAAVDQQRSGAVTDYVTVALLLMSPLWLLVIGPSGGLFFDQPYLGDWQTTGVGLIILATAIGVALLWRSEAWSQRVKFIALAGVVIGLAGPATYVVNQLLQFGFPDLFYVFAPTGRRILAPLGLLCVAASLAAGMYLIVRRGAAYSPTR